MVSKSVCQVARLSMEMASSCPHLLLEFCEAEVVAKSVVCGAARDHALGIIFGGGEFVDGVTAV